jgi:hypothetical protein
MGRVGPKSEDGAGESGADRRDIKVVVGVPISKDEERTRSRTGGASINSVTVESSSMGCLGMLIVLAIFLFAVSFPIYLVVMGFAGGHVPVLDIQFDGSIGEGLLTLLAAPVLFVVLLIPLAFVRGMKRRRIKVSRDFVDRGDDR